MEIKYNEVTIWKLNAIQRFKYLLTYSNLNKNETCKYKNNRVAFFSLFTSVLSGSVL